MEVQGPINLRRVSINQKSYKNHFLFFQNLFFFFVIAFNFRSTLFWLTSEFRCICFWVGVQFYLSKYECNLSIFSHFLWWELIKWDPHQLPKLCFRYHLLNGANTFIWSFLEYKQHFNPGWFPKFCVEFRTSPYFRLRIRFWWAHQPIWAISFRSQWGGYISSYKPER